MARCEGDSGIVGAFSFLSAIGDVGPSLSLFILSAMTTELWQLYYLWQLPFGAILAKPPPAYDWLCVTMNGQCFLQRGYVSS